MTDLFSMMARHGYALTFALLLAEALGLPFRLRSRWWRPEQPPPRTLCQLRQFF